MLADVDDLVETDDAPCVVADAAAHAGDERVPAVQPAELVAGLLGDAGILRPVDDRREHAVDVQDDGGELRRLPQPLEQLVALHPPTIRAMKLALIGIVAGFMSALFGVGGGIVDRALLILDVASSGLCDGDVAGGDRDHRDRRHDHVRSPANSTRRRGACRSPRRGRRDLGGTLQQRCNPDALLLFARCWWRSPCG